MAEQSTMLPLGTTAPDFTLPEVTGGQVALADLDGDAVLVMFICRHCPYVKHVEEGLAALGRDYADAQLDLVAISANDAQAYPDDAPDSLAEQKQQAGFNFPYCHDESQEVARAYGAACTPDFFLFDDDRALVYRGQMDASRPGSGDPVTGADLRAAIDAVLAGEPVSSDQRPSMGCGIKWRA